MKMPIYTIWMYDTQKGVKKPIKVLDHAPTDWIELKGLLEEAMRMIWLREGRKEAILTLERHYAGKFIVKFRHYAVSLMPTSRRPQAFFRAYLNPKNNCLKVKTAFFSPELYSISTDYKLIEKNELAKPPPLVPKHHKTVMEQPKQLLAEWTGLRYPNYSCAFRLSYDHAEPEKEKTKRQDRTKLQYSTLIQKTKSN